MQIGILGLLGIAFVVLKLVGVITWSWWYMLLPFYVGLLLLGGIALVYALILRIGSSRKRGW